MSSLGEHLLSSPTSAAVQAQERVNDSLQGATLKLAELELANITNDIYLESGLISEDEAQRLEEEEERRKVMTWRIFYGVAAVCASVFFAAIYIETELICDIAFTISLCITPYTLVQRKQRDEQETLVGEINKFRNMVNKLITENGIHKLHCEKLDSEVYRLKKVEGHLEHMTQEQGSNVTEFCELLRENKEIQNRMKRFLKAKVVQNFVSILCSSDTDADCFMDDREIDIFLLKLRGANCILIDEKRFRDALIMDSKKTIRDVMVISKELLKLSYDAEGGDIFNIDTQNMVIEEIFSFEYDE